MTYKNVKKNFIKTMKSIQTVFSPLNLILNFTNIFFFGILLALWFWFIGSTQLYEVLDIKASEIMNVVDKDIILESSLNVFIDNYINDEAQINNTRNNMIIRYKENKSQFYKTLITTIVLLSSFGIIIGIFFLFIKSYKTKDKFLSVKDNASSFILFWFMILMFSTEAIFYFVVVKNFHYISTPKIINYLFNDDCLK